MKTLWIFNHYGTRQFFDCAGRHYWFSRELKKRGYNVVVFCSSFFSDVVNVAVVNRHKIEVNETSGVSYVFIQTRSTHGNGIDRVLNMCDFYHNLMYVAKKYVNEIGKPDVIIGSSVHPLAMLAGVKLAKKYQIPCIGEIRDLWPEAIFEFKPSLKTTIIGRMLEEGEHWIYRNSNALIFTKEGDTDYLKDQKWTIEQGGDIDLTKCHYINNGIDLHDYKLRADTQILTDADINNQEKFNVTYTGTIRPINSVGTILDCAKVLESYQDIQFLVYGDGNQLEELRGRIEKESIRNVKLKGRVERKYIPYILKQSSINLLNYSTNYNWTRGNSSNKLFEYMASGKPIISTVRMGYSLINKYRCGIELDECTPEALANAIVRFHDMPLDERQQYGHNAVKGANDFDFRALTDKLMGVIESVTR